MRKRKRQLLAEELSLKANEKSRRLKQQQNKLKFSTLKDPTFGYDGSVIEVKKAEEAVGIRLPRLKSEVAAGEIIARTAEHPSHTTSRDRRVKTLAVSARVHDQHKASRGALSK